MSVSAASPRASLSGLGLGRALAMGIGLLWLASPWASDQVDDLYISLAYAHNWVETGELAWNTGERVEGYSNFLLVALSALGIWLGLDAAAFAVGWSRLSALGILWMFHRALPRDPGGDMVRVGLVAWTALARWSALGMETPLYALLLASGWAAVLRGGSAFGWGSWLLLLASWTRPEGAALWIAACVLPLVNAPVLRPTRASLGLLLAASLAFVGYHALRVSWFGAFWPTPYLVKVAAHDLGFRGFGQLGLDLLLAGPILVGVALLGRPSTRIASLAAVPLALEAALLVRADGDWFGWSRLVLPGVIATSYAWLRLSERHVPSLRTCAVVGVLAVSLGALQVEATDGLQLNVRPLRALLDPVASYRKGLTTPQSQDVEWMAGRLLDGDRAIAGDVGMIGNVSRASVEDKNGLTDRTVARFLATREPALLDVLLTRYDAMEPARFLRLEDYRNEGPPELDPYLSERYPRYDEVPFGGGVVRWYRPRSRLAGQEPERGLVLQRWAALHERYPSHPWLAWRHALALADVGDLGDARQVLEQAARRFPEDGRLQEAAALDFPRGPVALDYVSRRGFALTRDGTLTSRPLNAEERSRLWLRFDVDAPGEEGALARISWAGPCTGERMVAIFRSQEEAPPPYPCNADGTARLEVSFLNDRWEPGVDRNLYVTIGSPRAQSGAGQSGPGAM